MARPRGANFLALIWLLILSSAVDLRAQSGGGLVPLAPTARALPAPVASFDYSLPLLQAALQLGLTRLQATTTTDQTPPWVASLQAKRDLPQLIKRERSTLARAAQILGRSLRANE